MGFKEGSVTCPGEVLVMGAVALRAGCLMLRKHCPESSNCSAGGTFHSLSGAGVAEWKQDGKVLEGVQSGSQELSKTVVLLEERDKNNYQHKHTHTSN